MLTEKPQSYWAASTAKTLFPKLDHDLKVDIAIIGGGITGLTAAFLLSQEGQKVAVIEQGHLLSGESGRTTAHLTEILDTRYADLLPQIGLEASCLLLESSRLATDLIEQIVDRLGISCGYKRVPAYLYAETEDQVHELNREYAALEKLGVLAKKTKKVPLPFETQCGIRIENQAQFHPGRYLLSLAQACRNQNVLVYERTQALELEDGNPCFIYTQHGKITASTLIIATHQPSFNRFLLQTKVASYRSYVIAAKLKESAQSPPPGLYWDLFDPYHYIRKQDDLWMIGGSDHKTGMNPDTLSSFLQVYEYARNRFRIESVPYHWSGQIVVPIDGVPFIGSNPMSKHIYIATGFSGNGITFGTFSGMLIRDLILKKETAYADLFKPNRIPLRPSPLHFASENKDFPLCFLSDRLKGPEVQSFEEIPRGEGRRLKVKGQAVAGYKDPNGKVHAVSAVCTHLGCYVHWNTAEKSWDCPCHGSRFSTSGQVLCGPASENLRSIDVRSVLEQEAQKEDETSHPALPKKEKRQEKREEKRREKGKKYA